MSLIKEQLRIAGCFAITNAAVITSIFIIRNFLDLAGSIKLNIINIFLSLISLGLFIYVFLALKKLLNQWFDFYETDYFIYLIIGGNVLCSTVGFWLFNNKTLMSLILTTFLLITLGIIYMIFAIKLFGLEDNLYGLLIPFAFTIIINGLCFVSVILLPLTLVVRVVSDVILGIVFFRAVEQS